MKLTDSPDSAAAHAQTASPRRADALSLARQYAALPEDKRAVFRARARAQGMAVASLPPVPLHERPSRFPLSAAQERLWFLWCLDPAHAGYHLAQTLQLDGELHHEALRAALGKLIERHEALRLRIEAPDGVPMQYPAPPWQPALDAVPVHDEQALHEALREHTERPFALQTGPLLRVALFRRDARRHVLHIVVHHIVADAWSMQVLGRDLLALYRGTALAPLPLQFADLALWQREWADPAQAAEQLSYWRAHLADAPAVLSLPHDHAAPPRRTHAGARVRRTVPAALAQRLRDQAHAARTTPFTLLLAAYQLLLGRYAGQDTVVVGVPAAGRARAQTESMIGFLIDTLVIRADLHGAQAFGALLSQLHERVMRARSGAVPPFAKLVEALAPERDLDHAPLFQVMFDLSADAAAPLAASDGTLSIAPLPQAVPSARFDLALNVHDSGPQAPLALSLTYSCERFLAETAQRMLDDYLALLTDIAEGVERAVGELTVGAAPAAFARADRRAPDVFVPAHARIAARASQHPARIALRCAGDALSYGALDVWAARIAAALRTGGLRAGERVGLLMTRTLALPAAVLGVLRAGGAFVPLDPAYPAARLQRMMADAGVRHLVCDAAAVECVPELPQTACSIDALALRPHESAAPDRPQPCAETAAQSLAYVIYTSGSTGAPKGVAISHAALAAHLDDFLAAHRIDEHDVVLQSSTLNFDVALHELMPALMQGARVVMRGSAPWTLDTLNETLMRESVTFARIPTALWQQWRASPPPAHAVRLRQITVGGEALPGDALQRWFDGPLASVAIDNLYGPTETTLAALHHAVGREDSTDAVVAIGGCYASRHAYVADCDGNIAPRGAQGELWIGGATLAQGYLGRPGLTAEHFVPDAYGEPGARVYRSGDLCRLRADGTVDFLGRIDQQIKLRGQRIEPGEIEMALRALQGIGEAVVELRGSGETRRLVAYYTGSAAPTSLDEALSRTLPASHIPSAYVRLDALPVLPNGKLDRRALPEPAPARDTEASAPQGAAETDLLAVWRTVLGRDDFGVTANFFALGGDSISSLRVIAQARSAGWHIAPRDLFTHPSVRALARVAQATGAHTAAAAHAAGASREQADTAIPLAPMQRWFFAHYPQAPSRWNQAVLLRSSDALDSAALRAACEAVLATHEALRARFWRDPESGEWQQRIVPLQAAQPALRETDLREVADVRAAIAAEADAAHASLDLAAGPLLRLVHMLTPDGARLLLVVHHLVIDGVSWRILLDDLLHAYQQAEAGAAPGLPVPAVPWSQWTRRLAAYAALPEHLAELAWWQAELGTSASACATPPVPAPALHRTARLDAASTARLAALHRLDDALLAALTQACAQCLPQLTPIVEMEGHGRAHAALELDLSRTVGWFTSQYPLRLDAAADVTATLRSLAERRRAVPAQGAHFNLLRFAADATSRAVLEALPAATLGFNYLGRFEERLASGRFDFAAEDSGEGHAAETAAQASSHALDVNALVAGGTLKIDYRLDGACFDAERADALLAAVERHLLQLSNVSSEPAAPGPVEARPRQSPAPLDAAADDTRAAPAAAAAAPQSVPTQRLVSRASPRSRDAQGRAEGEANGAARDERTPSEAEQGDASAFDLWRQRFLSESRLCARHPSAGQGAWQPLNASGAALTLFCLYPGFGLVGEYRFLAAALHGRVSVLALRPPDDPSAARFEDLAQHAAACVLREQPEGALHLLGWSFGGRLAVALAERLRAAGREIAFLGLLDTATHTAHMQPGAARPDALAAWLARQPDAAFLRPRFARAEALDALHYRLRQAHTLPVLDVPITFWQAQRERSSGRQRDWRPYTRAGVTVHEIDASHAGIVLHPALHASVADVLQGIGAAHGPRMPI